MFALVRTVDVQLSVTSTNVAVNGRLHVALSTAATLSTKLL
jgi:hypothetical protein